MNDVELEPIEGDQETPLATCRKVRWRGPDGGWRKGVLLNDETWWSNVIIDQHRGVVVTLGDWQYEFDGERDDSGNLK